MTDTVLPPPAPRPEALTPAMLDALAKTKPWVRFLAIIGFFVAGLVALFSIGAVAFGLYRIVSGSNEGAIFVGIGLLYLLFAVLYLFPSRYLWRYASSIADALASPSKSHAVEQALREQKSFWKFAGIVTLVMLLAYVPLVLLAIAIPNFISALNR